MSGGERRVYTVSELTAGIKGTLEGMFPAVWVEGEISNLRVPSSGHAYFTLKDEGAQLSAVLFRGRGRRVRFEPEDGMHVLAFGGLDVYAARGQYQLVVELMEPQGLGALQLAFEQLKRRLEAEGLFDDGRKRKLPVYPRVIGIVTSPTGAAIRDMLNIIGRRFGDLRILIAPVRVQGDGAPAEIVQALVNLQEMAELDVIVVGRGGGSIEDLWAFNEEIVARAIFESALPVVSAVGHEIDFTISDFVADVRAATPSAAAEIITEGVFASRLFVAEASGWLSQRIRRRFGREKENLEKLMQRALRAHPRRRLNEILQRLDDLQAGLLREVKYRWRECRAGWQNTHQRLGRVRPAQWVERRSQDLRELDRRLREQARQGLKNAENHVETIEARLRLLSPMNVLERGYSITTDAASGQLIRDAAEVKPGQRLKTRLKKGEVRSVAEG